MAMFSFVDWWEALSGSAQVFAVVGVLGASLLLLQTVMGLFGVDADIEMDIDTEISMDFGIFSFKSIVAFCTFFGWMGVVGSERGWSLPVVVLAASGAGFVAMLLVAYLLFQFQKLESSGTMKIEDALLEKGVVYLTIPAAAAGTGQVTLELSGHIRELQAVTTGDQIVTGEHVVVVDITEENVLVVEPAPKLESGTEITELI